MWPKTTQCGFRRTASETTYTDFLRNVASGEQPRKLLIRILATLGLLTLHLFGARNLSRTDLDLQYLQRTKHNVERPCTSM
jgi:hypothetical protein